MVNPRCGGEMNKDAPERQSALGNKVALQALDDKE